MAIKTTFPQWSNPDGSVQMKTIEVHRNGESVRVLDPEGREITISRKLATLFPEKYTPIDDAGGTER